MSSHLSHVMTLANGVIGVSVLAMPFCFKQCGIFLAIILLLLSSMLSRLACHFLVKSAVMSRRRNFEFLAFHAFGHMGKFFVELFIIGFLLGTCIAFFVVVGDLGPEIIGKVINKNSEDIRTSLLIFTAILIVLPLGLLRNIDSLATISTATIGFYICLVLKVIGESTQHIFAGDWYEHVNFWRPAGILQCLPIFAMALFCQTQLFEIYESVPNVSLEKMNEIVRGALNICTAVYVSVGLFGYIACCTQTFTGNILMSFERSPSSEVIKLCFVFSVAFSFPLVIFPCRASLNSLLFRRAYIHESTSNYMPETRFRFLTFVIVTFSLILGILIPNIEFVLGIVGATIGVMICLIFPAAFFISISSKNTNERLLAKGIVFVGVSIMILGTYVNLFAMEEPSDPRGAIMTDKSLNKINNLPFNSVKDNIPLIQDIPKNPDIPRSNKDTPVIPDFKIPVNRPEELPVPVLPVEGNQRTVLKPPKPDNVVVSVAPEPKKILEKNSDIVGDSMKESKVEPKAEDNGKKNDPAIPKVEEKVKPMEEQDKIVDSPKKADLIHSDAIKKEDSELAADGELAQLEVAQRHEELKKTLERHKMEQLEMLQEQRELLKDIKEQRMEFKKEQEERLAKGAELSKKSGQVEGKNEDKSVKIESHVEPNLIINKKNNIGKKGNQLDHQEEKEPAKIKPELEILDTKTRNLNAEEKKDSEPQKESRPENSVKDVQEPLKTIIVNDSAKEGVKTLENGQVGEKASDHILEALTNKKEVEETGSNQEKNLQKNESVLKKVTLNEDKETNRLQEFSLPIALKMSNQTKNYNDSGRLINESKGDFSAVRRDILQNNEREKREVEVQVEFKDTEVKVENIKSDGTREICVKRDDDLSNEKLSVEKQPVKKEDAADLLIRTNAYLSQQSFTDKISIDQNLAVNGDVVQLKKRDLKALKPGEDGGL
ncbi:putative sodium-coupled neutral amino acid transporter 10 [Belonocnema kinseyi]|uniref:putative sodium-coupled neutral amino acid transporter 10 n=1 Tax=Belonocnema kinseyi TaxID=2817044 RepID=UPI00143CC5EF|nr:putative sodium-coupled neutral amino acid transporter 10 [Belonocnema kinseyi]